ncbi:hypothetical protein MtrunA17_Chr8g0377131 [Medicago truncatula]|uniref:Uncharacterized protein n=1 Tax=Medicago truncatula TaxID=3880 RepID=A0A396GN41_MEDTR|nr:hypothetical protein MtrunA17_Chr8g0377131 [Medicago truncatula]
MKWAWRRRNTYKHLITTLVLESLVSAICGGSVEDNIYLRKNDMYFLWETKLLNTRILYQLLHSLAFMLDQGKIAPEVFHKFEAFQCVPNRDTYTFTLKALLITRCITDMTHQAASICQKMLLHPETVLPDNGDIIGHLLSFSKKYD